MDVLKLIHKALSDADIGTILGATANIIRHSELRHITNLEEFPTQRYRLLCCPIRKQA